jgi:protein-S-isoprenylcysteine O-methyltransferase Ste14
MDFLPNMGLGLPNGWILIALFYAVYLIVLRLFPREVVKRLYDRSGWTKKQQTYARIGFPFAMAGMILIIFTPLKFGQPIFIIGMVGYLLGFAGFFIALVNFKDTPMDQPVSKGLYRFSRNPQWVSFALTMLSMSLTVGSGLAFLCLFVRVVFNHFRILGEEKACLEQYGESYRQYMDNVPRYLLIF